MRGVILLSLLCFFSVAFGAATVIPSYSVSPLSVYSGDSGFISLSLLNSGDLTADGVKVNVISSSPELFLLQDSWATTLPPSAVSVARFGFKVNDSAPRGVYFVDFSISFTGSRIDFVTARAFVEVLDDVNLVYSISSNELFVGDNNLSFVVSNPNDRAVSNVFVKLLGASPFLVLNHERFVDFIPANGSVSLSFSVFVDEVSEGVYPVVLSKEFNGLVKNSTVNLRVSGAPSLTYEILDEFSVEAGKQGVLSFVVKNTGKSSANDVKVSLFAASPFSIRNPEQYVGFIPANSSVVVSFNYSIAYDAIPGIYPITLGLDYEDFKSHDLFIKVVGAPVIEIAKINTDPSKIFSDSELSISVQLENVGAGKAKGVKAVLIPKSVGVSGVTEYYIGSIDADDIDSAIFDLILGSVGEGPFGFDFNVTYADQDDLFYSLSQSFNIYVRKKADYSIIIVLVVLALFFAFFYFRKRIVHFVKNLGKMI